MPQAQGATSSPKSAAQLPIPTTTSLAHLGDIVPEAQRVVGAEGGGGHPRFVSPFFDLEGVFEFQ